MNSHKSLGMFLVCLGYLISGLLFIPFTIGAFGSYNSGVPNSNSVMQLGAIVLVLVLIPIVLAFGLWKGYKFAWALAILFAAFDIVLYLITFSSLNIKLSNGVLISSSIIGPLGYAIAYGIVYIGTYLLVIIEIILNSSLIYYLTRKKTKEYFGL
ncbi:MAG: hypothetical protein ABR981_01655 [Candidatus Micrarchaeaceae archaeon]